MYMLPARSSFSCLLLCACSGASALVLPPRAPGVVAQHSPLRAAAAAPSRHAAPVAAEERRGGLPFFLDIGTKGGIVFYSVIGIVAPFLLYNFLQDQMGMDVVSPPPDGIRSPKSTALDWLKLPAPRRTPVTARSPARWARAT